jgi:hypothetical protein
MQRWPLTELRRALAGALAGIIMYAGLAWVLPALPPAIRFSCLWLLFTFGPGAALGICLTRTLDPLTRGIILLGLGSAAAAIAIDLLGRIDLLGTFPYVAAALAGSAMAVWRGSGSAAPGRTPRSDLAACSAVVALSLATGAIAFAHRLVDTPDQIRVYGNYDSLDLAYYAAVSAEASHTVPPTASYYAGRELNYAYYPQLVLAMVHRFGDVPMLAIYFRYAWPAFLCLGALTAFVFVRALSSTSVALLMVVLMLIAGDFSYLAAWYLPHTNLDWDFLLWPTNFLSPTMEVLHFNSWTPSLPVFFTVLWGIVQVVASPASSSISRTGWTVITALLLASLFQFKPFALLVLVPAIGGAVLFSNWKEASSRRLAAVLAVSFVFVLPFVYRSLRLYADRRSELRMDFFLLPERMLIKLDLTTVFADWSSRLAPASWLETPILLVLATALFLAVGPGIRWLGVPGVWRALRGRTDPHPAAWRVVAWGVVAGVLIPFVVVTEPYNDTLQFYQTGLYLLWIFTAVALAAIVRSRPITGPALLVLAIAISLPSSIHYLTLKWTDNRRPPLAALNGTEIRIATHLRTLDPRSTVVLNDRPLDPSLMAAVSARRQVLAWGRYAVGSDDRRRDVEAFYDSAGRDVPRALETLRRYHVTHVIVHGQRDRVDPQVLDRLEPLIVTPEVSLYRVPESGSQD